MLSDHQGKVRKVEVNINTIINYDILPWFFQSPRRGLAVLTHGNQKDPCLSKSYMVGFAIIY